MLLQVLPSGSVAYERRLKRLMEMETEGGTGDTENTVPPPDTTL